MAERLFGTDGIRSKSGEGILTQQGAKKLGEAIGRFLSRRKAGKKSVLIGKDTRKSGPMIEDSIAGGLLELGADVARCGVLPTPGVAYLTKKFNFDLGIVISASHNPWQYNGVKCFGGDGFKLSDDLEDEIEAFLNCEDIKGDPIAAIKNDYSDIGVIESFNRCNHENSFLTDSYLEYLLGVAGGLDLKGMKLVVDCANGAESLVAPKLLEMLGASLCVVNAAPNGTNINERCGSLFHESLKRTVKKCSADFGLSFDGDGDRLVACDERANVLDGDCFMVVLAKEMLRKGALKANALVATHMSNVAVELALKKEGAKLIRTNVGDKYILKVLRENNLNFGGEQSGHMIFLDHSTTGDGLLSAIEILKLIRKKRKPASQIFGWFKKYPQVLVNIKVDRKRPFEDIPGLCTAIRDCEAKLGERGRVFVRYSGTEPLARVMVEGPEEESVNDMAQGIASYFDHENNQ